MFRKKLPRIYELRDQIKDPESPNSCFRDFDNTLLNPVAFAGWRTLENKLQGLDPDAWEFLRKEAAVYLTKWDEKRGRGREQVLNIINEARAYTFLRDRSCTDIHFIPRSEKKSEKTPDLQGTLGLVKVICEVKTINPSKDEAIRRRNGIYPDYEPLKLQQAFFDNKLMPTLAYVKEQTEAFDTGKEAKHIAYIILNFDAIFGEHKENYFEQIDQCLCQNADAVSGIEIVFHNLTTYFHKDITMKCATVVNDE